jgi:hypothetical protein
MDVMTFSRAVWAAGFGCLLAGCDTIGPTSSVTPQVAGRVLAADTRQPLAGVQVVQVQPGQSAYENFTPKGGRMLQQGRTVTTDTNGDFTFPSSHYLTFFYRANWWSLKLSFQTPHYAVWQTNFTAALAGTNPVSGPPVVQAGEILLQPLSK